MATAIQDVKQNKESRPLKPLPAPNSDFYELAETLSAEELAIVKQGPRIHGVQGCADH